MSQQTGRFRKTDRLNIPISPVDRAAVEWLAERSEMSSAAIARRAIKEYVARMMTQPESVEA